VRFPQPLGALIAADFDGLAANSYSNGIRIELAVASRTGFFGHDILLQGPKSGQDQ
jgi:hypothetical protein